MNRHSFAALAAASAMLLTLLLAGCASEPEKICTAFDNGEYKTMRQASAAMADLGPGHVRDIAAILTDDQDPKHQQIAAQALRKMEHDALPALDALIQAAGGGGDPKVRLRAMEAIGAIGPDAVGALDVLRAATRDEDYKVRSAAAKAIGSFGPAGEPAAMDLVNMLDRPEKGMGREAVNALKKIEAPPEKVLPEIVRRLDDPDSKVRGVALEALAAVGQDEKEYLPNVRELILDQNPQVRVKALRAYRALGGDDATLVQDMMLALSIDDASKRQAACSVLRSLGGVAAPAMDRLKELVNDPDPKVSQEAKAALRAIERASAISVFEVKVGRIQGLKAPAARSVVREANKRMEECVGQSKVEAKSEVVLDVSASGSVESVKFDPPLADTNIQSCIERTLSDLDFGDQPGSGKVNMTVYINQPSDEGQPWSLAQPMSAGSTNPESQHGVTAPRGPISTPEPEDSEPEDE